MCVTCDKGEWKHPQDETCILTPIDGGLLQGKGDRFRVKPTKTGERLVPVFDEQVRWGSEKGFKAMLLLLCCLGNSDEHILWNPYTNCDMDVEEWKKNKYLASDTISVKHSLCGEVFTTVINCIHQGAREGCACAIPLFSNCIGCKRSIKSSSVQFIIRGKENSRYCRHCKTEDMIRFDRRNMSPEEIREQARKQCVYQSLKIQKERGCNDIGKELERTFNKTKHHHGKEPSFDLTLPHTQFLFEKQSGCCAVTGIKFDTTKPYLCPSIDADDPEAGHTKENCQLALLIVNLAKNRLTTAQYRKIIQRAIAGDLSTDEVPSYSRPNNASSRQPTVVVDPNLPLNMTLRSRLVWDALVALSSTGEAYSRIDVGNWIREQKPDEWKDFEKNAKENVQNCMNGLVQNGYVEKHAVGAKRFYRPSLPLKHPEVHCARCNRNIPLDVLIARRCRSLNATEANIWSTNQYLATCRGCRTEQTMDSRTRTRVEYIWSKIKHREGTITKDELEPICAIDSCPILGLPLTYAAGWSPLQASPDKLDCKRDDGTYTKENTRVVSLLVNFGRKDFDITDDELKAILFTLHP